MDNISFPQNGLPPSGGTVVKPRPVSERPRCAPRTKRCREEEACNARGPICTCLEASFTSRLVLHQRLERYRKRNRDLTSTSEQFDHCLMHHSLTEPPGSCRETSCAYHRKKKCASSERLTRSIPFGDNRQHGQERNWIARPSSSIVSVPGCFSTNNRGCVVCSLHSNFGTTSVHLCMYHAGNFHNIILLTSVHYRLNFHSPYPTASSSGGSPPKKESCQLSEMEHIANHRN